VPVLTTSERRRRLNTVRSVPVKKVEPDPPDPLLVAIARVCRREREAAHIKQVRVAAEVDVDQSTLARFERAGGWPRHPKSVGVYVRAYAKELDLDPAEILHKAVELWAETEGATAPHGPLLDPEGEIETRARDAERRRQARRRRESDGGDAQSDS
jgi:hypothetical protein